MKLEINGIGSIVDQLRRQQAEGILTGLEPLDLPADFLERTLPRFTMPLRIRKPSVQTGIRSLRVLQGGKDVTGAEQI